MENQLNSVHWSKLLSEARKRCSLTQSEAAEELKVAVRTLRYWEAGEKRPQAEHVRRLAELYHTTPQELELVEGKGSSDGMHLPTIGHIDWGEAPSIGAFYGRTTELQALRQCIVESRCQLVIIHGLGGSGK